MTTPRILVIDDQLGSEHYRGDRSELLGDSNAVEIPLDAVDDAIEAAAQECQASYAITFCRGQVEQGGVVRNDFETIRDAVATRWGSGDSREPWALVLLDVVFSSGLIENQVPRGGQSGDTTFGEQVRAQLVNEFSDLPIVMLTAKSQVELEDQEFPYLSKTDLRIENRLTSCLLRHGRLDTKQVRHLLQLSNETRFSSPVMKRIFQEAFDCASANATVLLLGETGVGKEVVARYIHANSPQNDNGEFHGRNIVAMSETLIESELFGHEQGAYTGADQQRIGVFEQANRGTLLLDEIGDLPPSVQPKLLRALEEHVIVRVGGITEIPVDVRLITTTSKDLATIAGGVFREDLYHRINTVEITIPPLRERPEDILPLTELFMTKFGEDQNKPGITLSDGATRVLVAYSFPGNVRQLRNIIERLVIRQGSNTVVSADAIADLLPSEQPSGAGGEQPAAAAALTLENVHEQLAAITVDPGDDNLDGAVKRIKAATAGLLRRITGAALWKFRDTHGQTTNAIRLTRGNQSLRESQIPREVNRTLDRAQKEKITDEDLERLIDDWRSGPGGSDRG